MPDESVVAVGNILVIPDTAQRPILAEGEQVERNLRLARRKVILIGNAPRIGQQLLVDIGALTITVLR